MHFWRPGSGIGPHLTLADYPGRRRGPGSGRPDRGDVYAGLSPAQRQIARGIFLRLTAIGEGTVDTKRRAGLDEVRGGDAKETGLVLERLAAARLIVVGEDSVEVTHEALIRSWPRLRGWLTEDRERLRLHRQLTRRPGAGCAGGSRTRCTGVQLAAAKEWTAQHDQDLNMLERAFLDASNGVGGAIVQPDPAEQPPAARAAAALTVLTPCRHHPGGAGCGPVGQRASADRLLRDGPWRSSRPGSRRRPRTSPTPSQRSRS